MLRGGRAPSCFGGSSTEYLHSIPHFQGLGLSKLRLQPDGQTHGLGITKYPYFARKEHFPGDFRLRFPVIPAFFFLKVLPLLPLKNLC